MTKSDIRTILELFISWNDESCPIDIANLDSAVDYIVECLPSLPSNLDEAAEEYKRVICENTSFDAYYGDDLRDAFKAGAEWMAGRLEQVGIKESPSKTFPRVNEFETGASYRH